MSGASESDSESLTTIMYNVARMYESLGDIEAASRTYQEILDKHPAYIDGEFSCI